MTIRLTPDLTTIRLTAVLATIRLLVILVTVVSSLVLVELMFSLEDRVTMFSISTSFQRVNLVYCRMRSLILLETVSLQAIESIYLLSTPTPLKRATKPSLSSGVAHSLQSVKSVIQEIFSKVAMMGICRLSLKFDLQERHN